MNGQLGTLIRKELTELRADRKAIFVAILLPVLLYPAMFWLTSSVEGKEEEALREAVQQVAITGDAAALEAAVERDDRLEIAEMDSLDASDALADGRIQAWVDASQGLFAEVVSDSLPVVRLVFRGTRPASREAKERLGELLDDVRRDERARRYASAGGTGELDGVLVYETDDVATATESGGAAAGRFLIYFLVMSLFMSGSALATDMVAGEKERGTLETLYLIPAERSLIATAKYVVVIGGVTVSGILSLISIAACYRYGLVGTGTDGAPTPLAISSLLAAGALIVPLAILVGGVLLALSSYARSLKEAQYLVMPAMLITFIPGLLAMSQAVELNALVALIPMANVAFAMRDVLSGQYQLAMVVLASVSSLLWGLVAMRWVAHLLSKEEMVLGFDPEPFFAKSAGGRMRAMLVSMSLSVLLYFYVGNLLQARRPLMGLALSLWVVLPLLSMLTYRFAGSGGRVADVLSLRRPTLRSLLGAALLALGSLLPMFGGLMRLQARFLPSPEATAEALQAFFEGVPVWQLFVLGALSPAICEELLFRGVFLGLLRRVTSTRAAVWLSSVFFGLIHLSIFRLLPTTLLGVLMAWITVRSRSIFAAMLFHLTYNGSLLVGGHLLEDRSPPFALDGPVAWALSAILLGTGWWLVRRFPNADRT